MFWFILGTFALLFGFFSLRSAFANNVSAAHEHDSHDHTEEQDDKKQLTKSKEESLENVESLDNTRYNNDFEQPNRFERQLDRTMRTANNHQELNRTVNRDSLSYDIPNTSRQESNHEENNVINHANVQENKEETLKEDVVVEIIPPEKDLKSISSNSEIIEGEFEVIEENANKSLNQSQLESHEASKENDDFKYKAEVVDSYKKYTNDAKFKERVEAYAKLREKESMTSIDKVKLYVKEGMNEPGETMFKWVIDILTDEDLLKQATLYSKVRGKDFNDDMDAAKLFVNDQIGNPKAFNEALQVVKMLYDDKQIENAKYYAKSQNKSFDSPVDLAKYFHVEKKKPEFDQNMEEAEKFKESIKEKKQQGR